MVYMGAIYGNTVNMYVAIHIITQSIYVAT